MTAVTLRVSGTGGDPAGVAVRDKALVGLRLAVDPHAVGNDPRGRDEARHHVARTVTPTWPILSQDCPCGQCGSGPAHRTIMLTGVEDAYVGAVPDATYAAGASPPG